MLADVRETRASCASAMQRWLPSFNAYASGRRENSSLARFSGFMPDRFGIWGPGQG